MPPVLIPIYQGAAARYGLGPQGASVLAGINEIETAFGTNLNVSSAGAMGWMQFISSTWEIYGVDANGDGVKDPYNPEDAIFAAASYLSAAGMPADTYDAIYSYNHADWYVAEVLANAACYAGIGSSAAGGGFALTPQLQVLSCRPADDWRKAIPAEYMKAFENAAARYELGEARRLGARRGRPARVELRPRHGQGADAASGPLGLDGTEWKTYAVDGDEDGHISARGPRRLRRDAGPADLVAGQHPRRHLHPQPGPVVRAGGARRGRTGRRRLQAANGRLAAWPCRTPRRRRRSTGATSPSPTNSSCAT